MQLISRLRTGLHAYRQLGPRRGTATVARRLGNAARSRVRGAALQRRPLQVGPDEVRTALGGRDPVAALSTVGDALPCVRQWERALATLTGPERADLLRRADDIVAHRFDLLGSGPTELGAQIDWHRDFKSGRAWPLDHITSIRVSYPDTSDIKVPWELSRAQHLPLLAAAYRVSGERSYLDELGAQLRSWLDANPVEFGVNWACTMDVAIRAVNWLAALVLCDEDAVTLPGFSEVLASLLLHGRFIRRHLEYGSARGNHYLSDVVGLLVVAALFSASAEGRAWASWAVDELAKEMRHQVRHDGCDHEASISYHRLVTELFIVGADAADSLVPGRLDPEVRRRIEKMLGFVAAYTRPDGLAPQIGDADDGRVLPLGDYASADQRSHLHLFAQARQRYAAATRSAAYRDGGFYILRAGDLYAAVRCGDVGIYGRGCHAHNDLLAFELSCETGPLVVDPGSYLYTADPQERNRFRSTAMHSALQVDGAEQNEFHPARLFAMVDRARPELLSWEVEEALTSLSGRHFGFATLAAPAVHTRTLRLDGARRRLEIIDELVSEGVHDLSCGLTLAPCEAAVEGEAVTARFPGATLRVHSEGWALGVEEGWVSPSYGVRVPAPVLRLRGSSRAGHVRMVTFLELV